ncbi:MAG: DoxX family protein [Tenacibaculum sp.]
MLLKAVTQISRVLVGVLFVYAGFVKLVDPIGSQYKFEEYFSKSVLNIEFLTPYALAFSILLIIAELVLGIMLLVGYKPKFTVRSLFFINLFFLFLTWYSYTYNKVTDCGCFGDAIKLSPEETFYKNLIFMGLIVILIWGLKHIKPILSARLAAWVSLIAVVISLFIANYVLKHLPFIDFRAYAVGTDIAENMIYKGDGEIPPIHDFMIETEQGDQLNTMLSKSKALLIVMYSFEKANKKAVKPIAELAKKASNKGYEIYILTASYIEDVEAAQKKYRLPYAFGFCDETTLKTMVRANPGIITVEKGIIGGKWNWIDTKKVILK